MKKIFLYFFIASFGMQTVSFASYTNNRLPSPRGFVRILKQKFPMAFVDINSLPECLRDENLRIAGLQDPSTGAPYNPEPDQTFLLWYAGCVQSLIRIDFQSSWKMGMNWGTSSAVSKYAPIFRYFSPVFFDEIRPKIGSNNNSLEKQAVKDLSGEISEYLINTMRWSALTHTAQTEVIKYLFNSFLGNGYLDEKEESDVISEIQNKLEKKKTSISTSVQQIVISLALMTDIFLSPPL